MKKRFIENGSWRTVILLSQQRCRRKENHECHDGTGNVSQADSLQLRHGFGYRFEQRDDWSNCFTLENRDRQLDLEFSEGLIVEFCGFGISTPSKVGFAIEPAC